MYDCDSIGRRRESDVPIRMPAWFAAPVWIDLSFALVSPYTAAEC